ncbi:MAG: tRNA-dihydrouridine synthase family protein [Zoogloeaceae bacterium]|nr:tRNA-dihydrouridine synthase family protein [Zoogloeaceae bacterium]
MKLLLAPMEGLADDVLRQVLTRAGGYDWAVTEFARVTGTCLPPRFWRRLSPELLRGGVTAAGTPVRVQLLGSDPRMMAENTALLGDLNPPGVDLNFGCPAPIVNRHRGGAVLLDEPELLFRISAAVRGALPDGIPFSAKMRLGVDDPGTALECAQALAEGGVELLVVHARTKADGYRPPAHWEWVARIAETVPIPVVANGEVWTSEDWANCRSVSGVTDVMLGRGAVADPFLARRIKSGAAPDHAAEWPELLSLLGEFWERASAKLEARHVPGRLKQWLNMLRRNFAAAELLYRDLRALRCAVQIEAVLRRHGVPLRYMAA